VPENFSTPYADYDVLAKWDTPSWNEQTREVVRKRLRDVPPRRFLEPDEWETLEAVCARVLPQSDRGADLVPIVPFIDAQLHRGQGDGYRYEDMPDLRASWRLGIAGIEREARRRHDTRFGELDAAREDSILTAIQNGEVEGEPWDELPPQRFFSSILLKSVVGIYYAHPAAWSEIGFGGPASPRGYVRLGFGQRDPWEAREIAPGDGGTGHD
jgi:hypothetical protein